MIWIARSTANQVGCTPCYPIRKVITPVPVEGGVAGGALPILNVSPSITAAVPASISG